MKKTYKYRLLGNQQTFQRAERWLWLLYNSALAERIHDRDYNAAKNIRRVGQTLQEETYAIARSVS